MLKRKLSAALVALIAAQLVAVACYVSGSRTCPARANRGTATCSLDNGSTYSWVGTGNSGTVEAQSDGTYHCHYSCPNGTGFWAFPGSVTTGSHCGE